MDCDTNFKVTMSIKKEANGVPIFFKVDGNRFKKEKTVKLMVDTHYRVDFSFKPTQTMTRAVICGEEVEATERVYDSTASAYSSRLHTDGALPSPKGHRDDLPLLLQLKGGLVMQMSLQVKYYKTGDAQHCDWGSTFHCIEYDCETHTDAGIVAVLKETFRYSQLYAELASQEDQADTNHGVGNSFMRDKWFVALFCPRSCFDAHGMAFGAPIDDS